MSLKITDRTAEEAFSISKDLWEHPELSGEEHRSAELLAERIAAEGFQVMKGAAGLETAFVAEWAPVRRTESCSSRMCGKPSIRRWAIPTIRRRRSGTR